MKKKVYELAKEMGIQSKDLIAKAGALGIEVKSHMSALTEADIDKIKGSSKEKKMGKKPPVGKPIVDNEYLANKPKPPVGKPIVDESIFANRDKAEKKDNTDVKTEKEVRNSTKSVEKKEKMPKKETQRANRKENKEDHKIAEPKEIKNTESKEAKNIEPEEVKKEDSKTVRKLASEKENMPRIKIVAKAEDVVQEEAARKAARAERVKKEAERKSGENKSDRKTSGDAYSVSAGGGLQRRGDKAVAIIQGYCPMDPNKSGLALKLLAEGMKDNTVKMDADKVQKVKAAGTTEMIAEEMTGEKVKSSIEVTATETERNEVEHPKIEAVDRQHRVQRVKVAEIEEMTEELMAEKKSTISSQSLKENLWKRRKERNMLSQSRR